MNSLRSPLAERVLNEMQGRMGDEIRSYTFYEDSISPYNYPAIFIYPSAYGDLDGEDLMKYSSVVIVNREVVKDTISLFKVGHKFE